jgi:hypothetical protein
MFIIFYHGSISIQPSRSMPVRLRQGFGTTLAFATGATKGAGKIGGGAKGNRTPDLLHAMQALYQLSYSPKLLKEVFNKKKSSLLEVSPKL